MAEFDPNKEFEKLKKSVEDSLSQVLNVDGERKLLRVNKVEVDDKLDPNDFTSQKQAKLRGGTWSVPVYADLSLIDKTTGEEISRDQKVRVGNLPRTTARNSYIVGGNEYQVQKQLRLNPGVYIAQTKAGDLKAQINLAKGGVGKNLQIIMDEDRINLQAKQAKIPLYDLLRGMGMTHKDIREIWGAKAADANADYYKDGGAGKAVARFEKAITSGLPLDRFLEERTAISPESTKVTLGKEFSKLSPELLAYSGRKLLRVKEGVEPMLDRDSLFNKGIHDAEDYLKERLTKKALQLQNKIKFKMRKAERPKDLALPTSAGAMIEKFFTESDKSQLTEQTNPVTMLADAETVTILGEGGLSADSHQVTPEMRQVHPTHAAYIDPLVTPEGEVGAKVHLPILTRKEGNVLKTPLRNMKTGQTEYVEPATFFRKRVAFADQYAKDGTPRGDKVKVIYQGQVDEVPAAQVDYRMVSPKQMFALGSNMIPFLPSNQGNRSMMAAKHITQAIPLLNREAPLVQTVANGSMTFEEMVGSQSAAKAPVSGVVEKVGKDEILIRSGRSKVRVPLYDDFPLNQNTFLNHTPKVKVGDKVSEGDVVADSNYTKDGTLALGTNLRAAFVPYKGYNYEDGIVITESASNKLTSEHLYKESILLDDTILADLAKFRVEFRTYFDPPALDKLDAEGVVRRGSRLQPGDPVFAMVRRNMNADKSVGGKIHKKLAQKYLPVIRTWEHDDEGTVVDVERSGRSILVTIKTQEAAKVGDKLALRHGNKGVITKILPDTEAPYNADGDPVDVMFNPQGVVGRMNVGQLYESAVAKAMKQQGKTFKVDNFGVDDNLKEVESILKKAKVSDKEILYDPHTKAPLGEVHVGNPYVLKLHKQSEKGYSVRGYGPGAGYDKDMQPAGSGEQKAKSLDMLTLYSMLSHGARENLREMSIIKGQRNDEYWEALKTGQKLPAPAVPFVFERLRAYLRGAGVDTDKRGNNISMFPLTDSQIGKISKMAVTKPAFVRGKQMQEIRDGFFDPVKLGGIRGENWGHLEFKEPVVNPVFETPIKTLLNLSGSKYKDLVTGATTVDVNGKQLTGGAAVAEMLKGIDLQEELKQVNAKMETAKAGQLDKLERKKRYLETLIDHNIKPEEAYVNKKIPVLPPVMRAINTLPDGSIVSPEINYIYQGLGLLNMVSKYPVMDLLDDKNKKDLREEVYKFNEALRGLSDINVMNKQVTGFLGEIKGKTQPKQGLFQRKVLKKKQDLVGRGVILPEPSLGVDEVGLPKDMLWKLYEPFVVRSMVKRGMSLKRAEEEFEKRTPVAQRHLDNEIEQRPVMLNRAPSLHKFSIMGFKPRAVEGRSIKIPSLVTSGFNADFDGDQMTVHVPISDKAVEEAKNMMPSRHLYKPGGDHRLMLAPNNESALGVYLLSKTDAGRAKLNKVLPEGFKVDKVLDKGAAGALYSALGRELPAEQFAKVINGIKQLGEISAYENGFTLGIGDLVIPRNRDALVREAVAAFKRDGDQGLTPKLKDLRDHMLDELKNRGSNFFPMVDSGAASSKVNSIAQVVAAPVYVKGYDGKTIPVPVTRSYAEGLDTGSYWQTAFGARSGTIDRAVQTSGPGAFSKDVLAGVVNSVVSEEDCGTKDGVEIEVGSRDLYDRYLARDQYGLQRNTEVTSEVARELMKSKAKTVLVRSPLTCEAENGICRYCAGNDERGQLPPLGDNVGVRAGQAIAEPMTQMTMRCEDGLVACGNKLYAFCDAFAEIGTPPIVDGDVESKQLHNLTVVGKSGDVAALHIQRHKPHDRILLLTTKSGHSLLCQANHPLFIKETPIHAIHPNRIVQLVGDCEYSDHTTRQRWKAESEASIECQASEVRPGDAIWIDRRLALEDGGMAPDVNPYLVGLFLSDGSMRVGNGTERYRGVEVAIVISKPDQEIQEKLALCTAPWNPYCYTDDVQYYGGQKCSALREVVRGSRAWEKRLVPGFNLFDRVWLRQMLDGVLDGDGTVYMRNGVTVATVYSSSYYFIQQLQVVAARLGISFRTGLVKDRDCIKRPQFTLDLRFPEGYLSSSIRVARAGGILPRKQKKYSPIRGFDVITGVREVLKWDYPVYDVQTETKEFLLGMVQCHNTFHTGGAAGAKTVSKSGLERITQLIKMPSIIPDAAPIAFEDGRVDKMSKGVAGMTNIHVGKRVYHAPRGADLKVKVGDTIKRGDVLSAGAVAPQKLLDLKGMLPAQQYIVDELQKAYKDQSVDMDRKTFETVVRSASNFTKIENGGPHSSFTAGEFAPYRTVEAFNAKLDMELPVDEAGGYILNESIGVLRPGKVLAEHDLDYIKRGGKSEIRVRRVPIKHRPMLKGIHRIPQLRKDWMAQMGYHDIVKAVREGASEGWKSDVSGYHPIPAFAYGVTFGQGEKGKY